MKGRIVLSPWLTEIDSIENDEVCIISIPLEHTDIHKSELLECLNDEERGRADRFRVEKPRNQFVITRGFLRKALGRLTGVAPKQVSFGYSGIGKPFLLGQGDQLQFNVSHTDGLALIAIARQVIGVDLEKVRSIENMDGLIVRFFSEVEQACYLSLDSTKRPAGFFRGWTSKEAVIKAAGLSVSCLDAFDVEINPDRPAKLLEARKPEVQRMNLKLAAFVPADGYVAAVAVEGVVELVVDSAV